MMYVALLRGVNVGGKGILKMSELKKVLSAAGLHNVKTLLNSGNLLFQSKEGSPREHSDKLERLIYSKFKLKLRVLVLKISTIEKMLLEAPTEWKRKNKLRMYMAFVIKPVTVREVMKAAIPREGVDHLKAGKGVIYMSTKLNGLTKSGLSKLASLEIYKDLTIRNYNTVVKLSLLK